MSVQTWRALGLAAAVLSLVGTQSIPASADSPTTKTETHCVVEVVPIDGPETFAPVCFTDEVAKSAYLEELGASQLSRGAAASTVVGTVYQDASGAGSSLTFWGSSGCSGVTFGFSSLPSGWDNSISSAGGSNGCWLTLYSATSYGGSRLNCTAWCGSVFGLNDNVKSLVFRPTGTFG